MATFGWSYKNNVSGVKRPKELTRKVENWQKERQDIKIPLHSQTHSAESVNAGMKRRRYHPRAKIFVGNLNKDTKPVTLAEYFSFFGEIAYLKMVKDHNTGISRGFAFITFVEVDEAEKAVRWCKSNHSRIDDKEIKVGFAERRQRPAAQHQHLSLGGNTNVEERRDTHTLYWEYKWTQDTDSEVYGPYETGLMLQWHKMGYFSNGCWVRQVHHATGSHEQKTQDGNLQDRETDNDKSKLTALVDSYSSSSDEEESPTKTRKMSSPLQHGDSSTDEDEQHKKMAENNQIESWKNSKKQGENDRKGNESVDNEENILKHYQQSIVKGDNINVEKLVEKEEKALSCKCTEKDGQNNDTENQDAESQDGWYQAERGGYKLRDMFGRDSSSEDEDYNDLNQQLMQNEFVHINEIDFSMFP